MSGTGIRRGGKPYRVLLLLDEYAGLCITEFDVWERLRDENPSWTSPATSFTPTLTRLVGLGYARADAGWPRLYWITARGREVVREMAG